MKTNLPCILVVVCLTFALSEIAAQEKQGEILHGVIESVDGNKITVKLRSETVTNFAARGIVPPPKDTDNEFIYTDIIK